MEDMDLAAKYAQIQLGHSFAAVSLAIFNQDLTALVRPWIHINLYYQHLELYLQLPLL